MEIVSKLPQEPRLLSIEVRNFKPPRPAERLPIEVHVAAEPVKGQKKHGTVRVQLPSWSPFEVYCDEGSMIKGEDTAPSPLCYFTLGVAFCFLSHIDMYLNNSGFRLQRVRIEINAKYSTDGAEKVFHGQVNGRCDGYDFFIHIDTDEKPDAVRKMVGLCTDACMALQTVLNATPVLQRIILNGEELS
ncbi:MAG: OsmC family protein [Pseudomonadota bacterium]